MIFRNRCLLFLAILFLSTLPLSAQTAAEMDALLQTDAVTIAASARFVLGAANLLPPDLSGAAAESAAWDLALSKGWVKGDSGGEVTLKDTAFLVMNAFNFKGGVLYSLFHSPRYAYREMVYLKLIQGRFDPAMKVSGTRLLQIIGSALSFSGENDADLLEAGGSN